MTRFSIHGSIELDIDERILLAEGAGPWNKESISDSDSRLLPLLEELEGSPWGALVTLHGDPIYVPDAAALLIKSIIEQKKQGRVATAVIVKDSNSPEFAKRHLSEIYDSAGEIFRFFPSKEEAKWWLVQRITLAQNESPKSGY